MFHGCLSILSNFSQALSNMEMFSHNIPPMKFEAENHFSMGTVWVRASVFLLAIPSTSGGTSIFTFTHSHRHTSMFPTRSFLSNFIFAKVFLNIHTSRRSRKWGKNKLCETHQKLWRRKGVHLIAISSIVECVDFCLLLFFSHIHVWITTSCVHTFILIALASLIPCSDSMRYKV